MIGSRRVKIQTSSKINQSRERIKLEQEHAATCDQYNTFDSVATKFVTDLLSTFGEAEVESIEEIEDASVGTKSIEIWRSRQFKGWPTIETFNVKRGKMVIDDYIASSWECREPWAYNTQHILTQSDKASEFYIYQSSWSLPTKKYPIPQVTTDVFFTIEVSRVKPAFCLVEVTYRFEGGACVYYPFKQKFDEKRLLVNLDAKLKFCKSVTF